MTLDEQLAVAIARSNMQDYLLRNSERWSQAEPVGSTGRFIVLTPQMPPCAVLFIDHQGNAVQISALAPGHVFRVTVEVLETVTTEEVNERPP